MDTLGNVNYAIRIDGYWTFDSNYEKHFVWQKNHWIYYALLPLVKNKLSIFKQSFTPLDTCEHQFVLKLDKHEDVSKRTMHKYKNWQKWRNKFYLYIDIW